MWLETPGTQSSAIKHYGTRAASRSLCVPLFGLELGRPVLEAGLEVPLSQFARKRERERERPSHAEMLVCRGLVALGASDELLSH